MICCGFGNREIFYDISEQLDNAIKFAIEQGCTVFFTGAMGDFDKLFASTVRRIKKNNSKIKLYCIKSYMTKEFNDNPRWFSGMYYDDVIIPEELMGVHYKSAITKRNQWMVDRSEIVITYTIRNYGGAYNTMRYAQRKGKYIIK